MNTPEMQKHFEDLKTALANSLVEREEETQLLLLGLLSGEHVLFVGPPGTGKSLLCNSLAQGFLGASTFGILLTKFTTPEELFGPISLKGLKEDRFERVCGGFLPTCDLAFVDEVWKASSAILNTLLTVMQERRFRNGDSWHDVPLRMMIAASNEWPIGEGYQELGAAFDRFLLRKHVRPVSPVGRERLTFGDFPAITPHLDKSQIEAASKDALALTVADEAKEAYGTILDELSRNGIRPGDRRIRKSVAVAKANAWLSGDSEVRPHHLEVLKHTLWEDPREHPAKTAEIVSKISNPMGFEINQVLGEADEALNAIDIKDIVSVGANLKKVEQSVDRLKKISRAGGNGRCDKAIKYLQGRCMAINKKILGVKD